MTNQSELDENAPEIEVSNIVNQLLLEHKAKWNGDDEIQDMVVKAFLLGVKWGRERAVADYNERLDELMPCDCKFLKGFAWRKGDPCEGCINGRLKQAITSESRTASSSSQKRINNKDNGTTGATQDAVVNTVMNAYLSRLELLIREWDIPVETKGLNMHDAGLVIKLSEDYLRSLNSYSQYRIFLSTVSMIIKTNSKEIDERKAGLLLKAISEYKTSKRNIDESKKFIKKVANFGLSPLAIGV